MVEDVHYMSMRSTENESDIIVQKIFMIYGETKMVTQYEKAERFKSMHESGLFVLPNAWNGGSAKVFDKAGFSAIGTTSAGIAYSKGYPDGEKISFNDIRRVTEEIVEVTNLPVSVDIERGFSNTLEGISNNVRELISLGAVGLNIEDGKPDVNSVDDEGEFCEKISIIATIREELQIPFFINARTDIFLLQLGTEDEMLDMTVRRAKRLKECGADCIFIPGALNEQIIRKLRESIELPINLFLHSAFCDTEKMADIGINRLSSGSAPVRTVFNKLIEVSTELKNGDYDGILSHNFNYPNANYFFE